MLHLHSGDTYRPATKDKHKMVEWIRSILEERTSRNLLAFLILNFSFAFLELFFGMWTNSLGLISDSFHMFFDCTALLAGLIATVISRWSATEAFSYGYVRAEILTGFVNSLFLIFIAFSIFTEAVERIVEPPEVLQENLFLVATLGLIVNLIGIFVFHHGHSHHAGHEHAAEKYRNLNLDRLNVSDHSHSNRSLNHVSSSHSHSHRSLNHVSSDHSHSHINQHQVSSDHDRGIRFLGRSSSDHVQRQMIDSYNEHRPSYSDHGYSQFDRGRRRSTRVSFEKLTAPSSQTEIMHGVFLHILADALGSIGVIVSSSLIYQFGWMIADPICSIFISVLIVISAVPLLHESAEVLMQRTPQALEDVLPYCYERVNNLDGVYAMAESHFWTLCTNVYVGTIRIEVTKDADNLYILSQTQDIFTQVGVNQLFVQIELASESLSALSTTTGN